MNIGIDFGTTRIVVAASDRGNFPLVNFETADGQLHDWMPPIVAMKEDQRIYGWDAIRVQDDPEWTIVRSLKRYLREGGPNTTIEIDKQQLSLRLLLVEMMADLRTQLLEHSNLEFGSDKTLCATIGVPANANSNQRFLTEEAARAAGFEVLGLINEPSAAAIEFAYRNNADKKNKGESGLAVYDLGGGTFDVSLVSLGDSEHAVLATDGLPDVGGDDFDQILADLALETAGIAKEDTEGLSAFERNHLLDECREKKETLNPNTRKVSIDLDRVRPGWKEVSIPVDDYYSRCRPLIEATREVVENLLARYDSHQLDTLYVTGGGAELPPVARVLRESFGRRVKRSAYMRSASAIGLAIRATTQGKPLKEQFTQNFGLWRESDHGGSIVFDLIFPKGAKLPVSGEPLLRNVYTYHPVHNIGHFRYLECTRVDADGQPTGEITNWDEIRFPFDPALQDDEDDLTQHAVNHFAAPQDFLVQETYTCDANGNLRVTISTENTGYTKEFRISHWATQQEEAISTAKKKKKKLFA